MLIKTWKQRYKVYKAHYGWTNNDVARISGLTPDTVRVATGREEDFPNWLKVGIVGFERDHNMYTEHENSAQPVE